MSSLSLPPLILAAAIALQPPGQFHGDEPVARDGETWLALRASAESASLTPTRLRVQASEDPILDAPGQTSGRRVSSALEPDPDAEGAQVVAYLRGGALAAGAVSPARILERSQGVAPPGYRIDLAGRDHRIRTQCTPKRGSQAYARDCAVVLVAPDGAEQVLMRVEGRREADLLLLGDDASPELLFAGDLDRDGRLDLIFDVSDHYNVTRPTLFLSSQARDGELLHAVSTYESVGC
ncbi:MULTISPECIES: hypothetical protein [unclassified Lysobacter]|uniref:hypothetical protein n=1 Tax=unclassified Lysobacter TaxID=2635362 RepID=UPI000A528056|nr:MULTISPECIES: hypothetical protein [unclassified Lysobacter]